MFFRSKYKTYSIGEIDIRIQVPKKSTEFADALPLFDIVWPSSEILCQLLQNEDIEGKRILEIGCGMALVSLYLKVRGANITAMDIHPLSSESLVINSRLNKIKSLPFVNESWAEESDGLGEYNWGEFDLIVGSDVLYEPQHILTLPDFLNKHTKPAGEVIIVDPDRGRVEAFRTQMTAFGFSLESFKPEHFSPQGEQLRDRSGTPYRGVIDRFKLPAM